MLIVCVSNQIRCSIYCNIFFPPAESQSILASSALIYNHSVLRMARLDPEFIELFEEAAWKPAFLWKYDRSSQKLQESE